MATTEWLVGDGESIAAYVPEQTFRSFLERRLAVPPDHLGILIRDGEVVDSYLGAQFSTGGLWRQLKDLIGGRHALRLLVADMKPFQLQMAFAGVSADQVEVAAEVTLEMQLDTERPVNVMGLVADNVSVGPEDISIKLRPHLDARVMLPAIRGHESTELRGNTGLQDQIQAEAMREIERIAGNLGLRVLAVSVHWAASEEETRRLEEARATREDQDSDRALKRRLRELERGHEATRWQLRADTDLEKVRAGTENELALFLQHNELRLQDARDQAQRTRDREHLEAELARAKQRRDAARAEALEKVQDAVERKKLEIEMNRFDIEFAAEERRLLAQLDRMDQQQALELARIAREQQLELDRRAAEDQLAIGAQGQTQQIDNLGKLQDLDERKRRLEHELDKDSFQHQHSASMDQQRLAADTELEKLRTQAAMNPDQILAVQAGLSPQVAAVFAERARTEGRNSDDKEALLREMVQMAQLDKAQSAAQAQHMFDRAADRLTEVGSAAATGRPAAASPPAPPAAPTAPVAPTAPAVGSAATITCPHCQRQVPASDRFCRHCGKALG